MILDYFYSTLKLSKHKRPSHLDDKQESSLFFSTDKTTTKIQCYRCLYFIYAGTYPVHSIVNGYTYEIMQKQAITRLMISFMYTAGSTVQ
jgi:hypothetical protein